jgi:hypothetical protein
MTVPVNGMTAPMTFGQLSLWRSEDATPIDDRPQWHFVRAWPVRGGYPLESMAAALNALVARHESLRTVFDVDDAVPSQRVMPPAPVPLRVEQLDSCSAEEALQVARRDAATPFDLTRDHGWRATAVRDRDGFKYLAMAIHHMTADTGALVVLKEEWFRLTGQHELLSEAGPAAAASSDDQMQARQLAHLQRSDRWEPRRAAATRYWRKLLTRYPAVSGDSGMSFSRKTQRLQATMTSCSLGATLARRADELSVTPQSAALAVILAGLAEFGIEPQEPLVVMASNRFDPRWRDLVTTLNQAAVIDVPPQSAQFSEFAAAVEWAGRIAYRHGCYDVDEFTDITAEVRGAPLNYDFFFNYVAAPQTTVGEPDTDQFTIEVGEAPQQVGPRLEIRVAGFRQMKIDIRADQEFLPPATSRDLLTWIGEQIHRAVP